jgi:hypothetical protein
MAVAIVMDFPGATLAPYDDVLKRMGLKPGGASPDGAIFHYCSQTDDGIRVIDVWETLAQFEAFTQAHIAPHTEAVGVPAPLRTHLTSVGAGDEGTFARAPERPTVPPPLEVRQIFRVPLWRYASAMSRAEVSVGGSVWTVASSSVPSSATNRNQSCSGNARLARTVRLSTVETLPSSAHTRMRATCRASSSVTEGILRGVTPQRYIGDRAIAAEYACAVDG